MPSSLNIRQVCLPRPKAGQLEDLVRVLALLGFAVGNFCRRDRNFRENRRCADPTVYAGCFKQSFLPQPRCFGILCLLSLISWGGVQPSRVSRSLFMEATMIQNFLYVLGSLFFLAGSLVGFFK
jgi:hypothetical protein